MLGLNEVNRSRSGPTRGCRNCKCDNVVVKLGRNNKTQWGRGRTGDVTVYGMCRFSKLSHKTESIISLAGRRGTGRDRATELPQPHFTYKQLTTTFFLSFFFSSIIIQVHFSETNPDSSTALNCPTSLDHVF